MQLDFWFGQPFGQTWTKLELEGLNSRSEGDEEDKEIKKLPIVGEKDIDVKCRLFGLLAAVSFRLSEWFIKLLQEEKSAQAEGWTSFKVKISEK